MNIRVETPGRGLDDTFVGEVRMNLIKLNPKIPRGCNLEYTCSGTLPPGSNIMIVTVLHTPVKTAEDIRFLSLLADGLIQMERIPDLKTCVTLPEL